MEEGVQRKHGNVRSFHEDNQKICKVKLIRFERTREQRKLGSSSEEEHKVNALASGAEEGRD